MLEDGDPMKSTKVRARRQFPDKSAMSLIEKDAAPGSQGDGGVHNPTKRQFPKQNAMKAIHKKGGARAEPSEEVQAYIEEMEKRQEKRRLPKVHAQIHPC